MAERFRNTTPGAAPRRTNVSPAEQLQIDAHQALADRAAAGAPAPNALDGGPPAAPGGSAAAGTPAPRTSMAPQGYDQNKWARGHDSPKYLIADAIGGMDLSRGITPEALAALNALNIGTFTQQGQGGKVALGGNIDPRFGNVRLLDLVEDASTGRGRFQYYVPGSEGAGGAPAATSERDALAALLATPAPEAQDVQSYAEPTATSGTAQPRNGFAPTDTGPNVSQPMARNALPAQRRVLSERDALNVLMDPRARV